MKSSSSSNSSSTNKSFTSSKSSPPKEKASPASPMDDIERGAARQTARLVHLCLALGFAHISPACFLRACAELMAEARVMDQLSSGDSSSDSNSSSSSSSDDSSSSSDSDDEQAAAQTSAPAKHSLPGESTSQHQERAGGLMNTLSEPRFQTHFTFTRSFMSVLYKRPEAADFPCQISHVCPLFLLQRATSSSANRAAKATPERSGAV